MQHAQHTIDLKHERACGALSVYCAFPARRKCWLNHKAIALISHSSTFIAALLVCACDY